MRVLLVVNPFASSVDDRGRRVVERALSPHVELRVVRTGQRDHATDLAHRAVADGMDAVVVYGGDGTLNEVATALAGTDCILGALPGGSTNVFTRTLGLPRDAGAAAEVVGTALAEKRIETIGLGEVNGRFFTFHTGVGWDAALVRIVERHSHLKRRGGHLLFTAAGLRTFLGAYDRSTPHFDVHLDGGEVIDGAFFCLVMNSDPYTFVGPRPFVVSPQADLRSGLSVVTMTSMRLRHFLPVMLDALRDGRGISERPGLTIRTGVRSLEVQRLGGALDMPFQVDGDHLGQAERLGFRHHPDALRLVVPPGFSPAGAGHGPDGR